MWTCICSYVHACVLVCVRMCVYMCSYVGLYVSYGCLYVCFDVSVASQVDITFLLLNKAIICIC